MPAARNLLVDGAQRLRMVQTTVLVVVEGFNLEYLEAWPATNPMQMASPAV